MHGVQEFISIAPWTIIFQVCNLLILMVVFKKVLFKPVLSILTKRQEDIESQYNTAKDAKDQALSMRADYEKKLADARQESDNLIKKAVENANELSNNILDQAHQEAAQIKKRVHNEIEMERKKAYSEVKGEISGIAVEIASKIIDREINEADHIGLIDDFIKNVGDMS